MSSNLLTGTLKVSKYFVMRVKHIIHGLWPCVSMTVALHCCVSMSSTVLCGSYFDIVVPKIHSLLKKCLQFFNRWSKYTRLQYPRYNNINSTLTQRPTMASTLRNNNEAYFQMTLAVRAETEYHRSTGPLKSELLHLSPILWSHWMLGCVYLSQPLELSAEMLRTVQC